MTFWEHLDELRKRVLMVLLSAVVASIVCFCFKDQIFSIIMFPKPQDMSLINTEITQQFITHMRVSLWCGILLVSPVILYQSFAFVAPGLYKLERRMALRAICGGYILFLLGAALCYFIILPFAIRFLGAYQVSDEVTNAITLSSYISLMSVLTLIMGVLFELPVVCWLLAKIGVLKAGFMRHYTKHAIVVIVIIGAIITPTGDPFTLMLVSVPIFLLWQLSILIVKHTEK